MNNSNLTKVKFIGMISIILLGLVFHELYKSTGNIFFGIISPVNESKWEHWKMAFWPMIIISLVEYYFIKDNIANYIFSLAIGIIVFELVTFGSIELYDVIIVKSHLPVHIITFLAGGIAGQLVRYSIMTRTEESKIFLVLGLIILAVQCIVFTVFTFNPPVTEYFRDSIRGTYGIFERVLKHFFYK